ncbi:hypothetical protein [Hyalangium rubrum]|uniref:Lipoprotein n=1 Tax=Hyalangium rubrum TaxID=3103134 RepID=A0ABU5H0C4_9BACT|nr:hypothetical protein [Hyalangium sp. s54d21]MDY7226860.1 hypothetical protein [Hyalangium sp. s54d21]
MPLSRWSLALTAALCLAGCKREEAATPAPAVADSGPAPAAAKPALSGGTHAATGVGSDTPAAALPPAPRAASSAVSLLKAVDPEKCEWVRQPLPSGEAVVAFSFGAACDRSMVSFSPDGKEGLVFSWPSGEGEVPLAWRVDLAKRTGAPLEIQGLPGGSGAGGQDKPSIEQIGFDTQGRVVAIVTDIFVERTPQKKKGETFITFEGKNYPVSEGAEGLPGLAHAYRLEEGGWKRFETKASGFESDLAAGSAVLEATKALVPTFKASVPVDRMPGAEASESAVKMLDAAFPGQDEGGQWMTLTTPGGKLHYRGVIGGEYLYPSAPVRWEQDGKLEELEGLSAKPDDFLSFQLQEDWLLVANFADQRMTQAWDTRTKKRVLSLEGASAPAFWPKTP